MASSRIAILGAGEVGSTIAYSLVLTPVASEILLVDPKEDVRDAQVQDLSDASYQGDSITRVRAGTHQEAGQCDIIVITAGAKQKKGESRTDLIGRNIQILESSINDMKPFRKDAIILVVANPVDVLTYFAQRLSGLPKAQVFGSGTVLDSARLRGLIARELGQRNHAVAASSVSANVLGEHGDSQVVAWSQASVAGIPLDDPALGECHVGEAIRRQIAQETKQKAAAIIESKGSTAFGIGGVVAQICKSVLYDGRNVLPVSHYHEDLGVCLSTPVIVGRSGLAPWYRIPLADHERRALEESAQSLKEVIEEAESSQK